MAHSKNSPFNEYCNDCELYTVIHKVTTLYTVQMCFTWSGSLSCSLPFLFNFPILVRDFWELLGSLAAGNS